MPRLNANQLQKLSQRIHPVNALIKLSRVSYRALRTRYCFKESDLLHCRNIGPIAVNGRLCVVYHSDNTYRLDSCEGYTVERYLYASELCVNCGRFND